MLHRNVIPTLSPYVQREVGKGTVLVLCIQRHLEHLTGVGAGDLAYFLECLWIMHEPLGFNSPHTDTKHSGVPVVSALLGRDWRVRSSRLSSVAY